MRAIPKFLIGRRYWIDVSGMKVAHAVEYSHERGGKGNWRFMCAPWVSVSQSEMEDSPAAGGLPKCSRCAEKVADALRARQSDRDALVGARLREFDIELYQRLSFPGPKEDDIGPSAA